MQKIFSIAILMAVLISALPSSGHASPLGPPIITANAVRDGAIIEIVGTVLDENVKTVTLIIGTGNGRSAGLIVPVIAGKFSADIEAPLDQDSILVTALDEEGLVTSKSVDIGFQP